MGKGRSVDADGGGDVPPEILAELRAVAALPEDQINTDDVPEVVDWSGGERGRFYRPVKRQVTLRIDADVLAFFKATETHYQTAINRALREAMLRSLQRRKVAAAG
jgi:uncharacterized protein (DUF4415 family)